MAVVRRAGLSPLEDGSRLSWMVAEGARGRRWRATTMEPDGHLAMALLLEAAPDGRLVKLELATADGLLTLHPEPGDARLHGNVVRPTGVEHLSLPWTPDHVVLVVGSPVSAAVAARSLAGRIGVGEGESVAVIEVGQDLAIRPATWHAAQLEAGRWHLGPAGGEAGLTLDLDDDGVPTGYAGELAWPLELTTGE